MPSALQSLKEVASDCLRVVLMVGFAFNGEMGRSWWSMSRVLKAKEWDNPDTVALARALIGRLLVVRTVGGAIERRRIIETEAYDGAGDLACHASKGKTPRTAVMFGSSGRWYVYLCYGVHEMLNLVTGPEGYAAAILIRGIDGAVGPGRLTKAMGIDRRFNLQPAARVVGLWVEDDDWTLPAGAEITTGPRVGVSYAGPEWSAKPWRFQLRLNLPRRSSRNGR